jgi:ligand-binding sensor domain-containing protein
MDLLKKKISLLFFLFGFIAEWLIPSGIAQSQSREDFHLKPETKFEHLTTAEGLSNSMVHAIMQDRKGFMWFGTKNGLNRYDGYNFEIYTYNSQDTTSLSDNTIHAITEDRKGKLWIGTLNGLNHFDPISEKVTRYQHKPSDSTSLSSDFIHPRAMCVDRKGALWIGTNKGLNQFNAEQKTFKRYVHQTGNPKSLSDDNIEAIFEDRKGILWIGTSKGLNQRLSGEKDFHTPLTDPNLQKSATWGRTIAICEDNLGTIWVATDTGVYRSNPNTKVFELFSSEVSNCIMKDSKGNIWIGTNFNGLLKVDPSTTRMEHFSHDPKKQSELSSYRVHSLAESQQETIWIGTATNGVDKFNSFNQPFTVYRPYLDLRESRKNADVHSIYEDTKGNIWIGTSGNGLCKLDPNTGKLSLYQHTEDPQSLINNYIFEIVEDPTGKFWIASWRGLNYLDPETGKSIRYAPEPGNANSLSDMSTLTILREENGALWIGTVKGGLNYFDPHTQKFSSYQHDPADPFSIGQGQINSIIKDDKGDLWITTERGGLNRRDHHTGRFYAYKHDPKDSTSLSTNAAMYVYQDKSNTIWVGTRGGGLNKMDAKTGKFTTYTTHHGLPDNYIVGILEDSRGNLWISTQNGLCSFNPQKEDFQTYHMQDGLHSNEFKIECLYKNQRGQMYFGGVNGLTLFHPDSVRHNSKVPPVYITTFKIFDKPVNFNEKQVALSYDENFFSFDFVALNYLNPQKNQYSYRLAGFDKNWIQSGTRRYASYTNLDPGTYVFEVKGSNNDGVWNQQGASIKVIIHPPFWRTWWFYSLSFITLAGFLYLGVHYRITQVRKEERLLREQEQLKAGFQKKLSEMEMQALRAQMNPHFIFNCLNSINRFILKNEPEAASDYLSKFSRLIRLILQNSSAPTVTLENELEALGLYLEMESLRFDHKFTFRIECSEEVEAEYLEIPPLIIQPYVENAIWHGLMHKKEGGHISIHVQQKEEVLLCSIEDDGVGRKRAEELKSKSATKKKSLGMQITAHRLELLNQMHDKQTKVEIVDLVDSGGEACGTRVVLHIPF